MTGDHNFTKIHIEAALEQCTVLVALNTTFQQSEPDVTYIIESFCQNNCSGHGVCNNGMFINLFNLFMSLIVYHRFIKQLPIKYRLSKKSFDWTLENINHSMWFCNFKQCQHHGYSHLIITSFDQFVWFMTTSFGKNPCFWNGFVILFKLSI